MKGKVALITGSATGLGKMTALSLARQGCHLAINYVNSKDEAEALSREIEGFGVKTIAIKADIASERELYSLVDQTEELGSIDILVNNAGPFIRERRLFSEYSRDEIVHMVNGNLTGVMRWTTVFCLPCGRKVGTHHPLWIRTCGRSPRVASAFSLRR